MKSNSVIGVLHLYYTIPYYTILYYYVGISLHLGNQVTNYLDVLGVWLFVTISCQGSPSKDST